MFSSILVPVDGSEHARKALAVACRLLSPDDGTLYLIHVPEPIAHEALLVWGIGAVALDASLEERRRVGEEVLTHAVEAAREQGATRVESRLGEGEPARAILAEADERGVEAIVMGSRGLGDFQGLVVGSVSHKVAHAAASTVITVR